MHTFLNSWLILSKNYWCMSCLMMVCIHCKNYPSEKKQNYANYSEIVSDSMPSDADNSCE